MQWQVAADPRFRQVVRAGTIRATAESAHAVHVEVSGLRSGREYYYRFRLGRHLTATGRARTAPAPWGTPAELAMAFTSCANHPAGYFTAYRRLAEEQPDLILNLGDYQYEGAGNGVGRNHVGPETTTLAGYRQRHAQYKTDPDLQAAHAAAPWLVVWDDHEVDNNYADDLADRPVEQPGFLDRRAAAYRAYYENMPLRRTSVPRGPTWTSTGGSTGGRSRRSTSSTPGSTGRTRPAVTATRAAPTRLTRPGRSPGRSRSAGCWTVSATRTPGGTSSPNRSSSASGTTTPRPPPRCRWTRGTATPPRDSGSPRAGWTQECVTRWFSPVTCTRTGRVTSTSTMQSPPPPWVPS